MKKWWSKLNEWRAYWRSQLVPVQEGWLVVSLFVIALLLWDRQHNLDPDKPRRCEPVASEVQAQRNLYVPIEVRHHHQVIPVTSE